MLTASVCMGTNSLSNLRTEYVIEFIEKGTSNSVVSTNGEKCGSSFNNHVSPVLPPFVTVTLVDFALSLYPVPLATICTVCSPSESADYLEEVERS